MNKSLIVKQFEDAFIYRSSRGFTYTCQVCQHFMNASGGNGRNVDANAIDMLERYASRHALTHANQPLPGQLSAFTRCGEAHCQLLDGHNGMHRHGDKSWGNYTEVLDEIGLEYGRQMISQPQREWRNPLEKNHEA